MSDKIDRKIDQRIRVKMGLNLRPSTAFKLGQNVSQKGAKISKKRKELT
jgi:hypothetical protein